MTRSPIFVGRNRRPVRPRHRGAALTVATVGALLLAPVGPAGAGRAASPVTAHPVAAAAALPAAAGALRGAAPHLASAPAGKLTERGCTVSPATDTTPPVAQCELYAMAGTLPILGSAVPIWGFSTTGAAGSATTPGPLLVVHQGDEVRITVHNQLPDALSLALPGQRAAAFAGGYGDDTTGVATNGVRTYSFVADRPGTFLYEAGHTPNGARQVAMGLAGALIVLTASGSAYPAQSGFPDTAYADDALLVISEVDPAFNAQPATFDLREFAPKYRLLNGKPYPATDPIATEQGQTVLLRYLNIGSQSHAMSLLGGSQLEIAQDAHPMKFAAMVTAETINPGQTLDALVSMPTGPEAKLALYEPAMHLDNNGQHTADPLQIAFGGLLTFLDTNAPPPSTDGVGPVSSHISLSPNPSDGKSAVTVTADLSDATTGGSAVTQAEVVVDDAVTTGVGFGVPMTATFGTVGVTGATATLPVTAVDCNPPTGPAPVALDCLAAGKHFVYVRALDAAGNWGSIGSAVFNLPKTGPQTRSGSVESPANGATDITLSATGDDSAAGGSIIAAEYFVDDAGADGSGIAMTTNRTATVVSEDATLAAGTIAGLGEGTHHLLVHSKDSLGLWGPPLDVELVVDLTGPAVDAADVAPNPSNAVLSNKSNPGYLLISAAITDRDAGSALQSNLTDAEAFLDPKVSNPPGGTGLQLLAVDGAVDSPGETMYGLIPISQIRPLTSGPHHVYVRGLDAAGNWGPLFGVNLVVDKIAPVLGAVAGDPNPTNGSDTLTLSAPVTETVGLGAAEFWLGTTDPGSGRGTRISVTSVGANAVATVPLTGIAAGTQRFNLRVQDTAGNWSNAANTTIVVSRPNAIFNGMFEGATPGWSSATGTVSTSTAARLPSVYEPDSTKGLAATIPSGAGGRVSYVTDTTPSAETGYHARFTLDRHTLTSGTRAANVLTLFEARTAGNNQVFALQFRMSGTTAQVRVGLVRNFGTSYGAWTALAAGQRIIQVDWTAGSAGSLVLSLDGVPRSTVTGNTGALRVETVLLGVTAGVVTGSGSPSGTAYYDSFVSTRNTLAP